MHGRPGATGASAPFSSRKRLPRARPLRFPWANLALLALLGLQAVTGLVGLLGASPPYRIAFWAHAIGAYAIVVLLFAKTMLVVNAVRRRPGLTRARVALGALAVLLLAVLVTGLVWITAGRALYVLGISVVNWHAYLALAMLALLAWHALDRRWIVQVPPARDRAAFLRLAAATVAGVALWQVERTAQILAGAPGSRRRFTGSYERGSFTGTFPAVSWLNDDPEPVATDTWRLVVDGEVGRRLELDYAALSQLVRATRTAVLDCTGGWCTEQEWRGVGLDRLLERAGATDAARSVVVESVTGYARRFSLPAARELLLATEVAGRPLAHGHGFPARLVVPDERGYEWVKWVRRISVVDSSELLQPPLPLS
jgi:hypothetical protein